MNGYLLAVTGTVLLCAILTSIVPNGKTSSVIKGTAKLACLLAIVAPIPNFINAEKSNDKNFEKNVLQTDDTFIQYYGDMRIAELQNSIEKALYDKFSTTIEVEIVGDGTGMTVDIDKIVLKLSPEITKEQATAMCEYVTKTYCSEVQIE